MDCTRSTHLPVDSSCLVRWLARVLVALSDLLPRLANLGPVYKPDAFVLAQSGEAQAPAALERFASPPKVANQVVLDLGCGLGGKTAYYADHGARSVIGLEIDSARAQVAQQYIRERGLDRVASIVIGDAARPPFRSGAFDLVMTTDTWEHLQEPDRALGACHRVTRAGGAIYVLFMPYYSPWGHHSWDWIAIPWLHVCLPPRWLWAIVRDVDRLRGINARRAFPVRLDWSNPQDPAHARGMTVARFSQSVHQLGTRVKEFTLVPIGYRAGRPVATLVRFLSLFPGLQELLTGLVACVMYKDGE